MATFMNSRAFKATSNVGVHARLSHSGIRPCFLARQSSLCPRRSVSRYAIRHSTTTTTTTASQNVWARIGTRIQESPLGRLAAAYSRAQSRRPYVVQICSILIIWLCGDLSAQVLFASEEGTDDVGESSEEQRATLYDFSRTLRHLAVGVVAAIPTYKWFMLLNRHFNFKSKVASLVTKVFVQQAVYTPVFNTYFFTMQSILSGASIESTVERLRLTLPTSIVNSVKVWSGVALVSFVWVPPQFRSVFSGVVAVGWQSYLSWMNNAAAQKQKSEKETMG